MNSLKIRLLAKEDIQEIVNYYDKINKRITNNFLNNLFAELEVIKRNPLIFRIKYKRTRVHYMKRFSIGIHYIFVGKTIEILAVLHTSRNPEIWKAR